MHSPSIGRRQALKILLAAGGGISLAGFFPSKWVKPIVKMGVLPVHAQSSEIPACSDLTINFHYWTHDAEVYPWFRVSSTGEIPVGYTIVGTPTVTHDGGTAYATQTAGVSPGTIHTGATYSYSDDLCTVTPKVLPPTISIELEFEYEDGSACSGTYSGTATYLIPGAPID